MKTTLLTIGLAVATMPMIFAASQVTPQANGSTANSNKPAVTSKTKKHSKKAVKHTAPKANATPAAAAKPASPASTPAAKPSK